MAFDPKNINPNGFDATTYAVDNKLVALEVVFQTPERITEFRKVLDDALAHRLRNGDKAEPPAWVTTFIQSIQLPKEPTMAELQKTVEQLAARVEQMESAQGSGGKQTTTEGLPDGLRAKGPTAEGRANEQIPTTFPADKIGTAAASDLDARPDGTAPAEKHQTDAAQTPKMAVTGRPENAVSPGQGEAHSPAAAENQDIRTTEPLPEPKVGG